MRDIPQKRQKKKNLSRDQEDDQVVVGMTLIVGKIFLAVLSVALVVVLYK